MYNYYTNFIETLLKLIMKIFSEFQMKWSEYDIQRVQDMNATMSGKVIDCNLKVNRYNRTIHTISGDLTFISSRIKKYEVKPFLTSAKKQIY